MILGIGTDFIEVQRIRDSLHKSGERLLDRILTPKEREYVSEKKDPAPFVAARFAAKEAILKALGTGLAQGIHWTDMEVLRDALGAPSVELSGRAAEIAEEKGIERIHISLSHTEMGALAFAVAE
jgi:holo-[acyl-carrier protein] synthase